MLLISQDEFIKARKEIAKGTDKTFFIDEINPVVIRRLKIPHYTILLRAVQRLQERVIYLQLFLTAEIADDIPYLEEHPLNEVRVKMEENVHKYVSESLQGITGDSTYVCDFDMHICQEDPKYYQCTAICSVTNDDGIHEEINIKIGKSNFLLLSTFLYQITAREDFIDTFSDKRFREVEFIPTRSFTRNSSCITTIGRSKKVLTHYEAYIGPRKFGFASITDLESGMELNNEMPEDEWKEWYANDPIISNIIYDERIDNGKLVEVIDILYPDRREIESKDGKVETIDKPYKVLQVELDVAEADSNFVDPYVIYKKN